MKEDCLFELCEPWGSLNTDLEKEKTSSDLDLKPSISAISGIRLSTLPIAHACMRQIVRAWATSRAVSLVSYSADYQP